jgi:hypothetical protein
MNRDGVMAETPADAAFRCAVDIESCVGGGSRKG